MKKKNQTNWTILRCFHSKKILLLVHSQFFPKKTSVIPKCETNWTSRKLFTCSLKGNPSWSKPYLLSHQASEPTISYWIVVFERSRFVLIVFFCFFSDYFYFYFSTLSFHTDRHHLFQMMIVRNLKYRYSALRRVRKLNPYEKRDLYSCCSLCTSPQRWRPYE